MKLNEKQSYATVHGHPVYVFEQGGRFFDGAKNLIDENGKVVKDDIKADPDKVIHSDTVHSASEFLKNLLSGGAMAKAILFKEAEGMNLEWSDVKRASIEMKIIVSQRNKIEFWQLAES
jgi:hypothetical protein